MSPKGAVLVIDDDREFTPLMLLALARAGFEAFGAYSGAEAKAWLAEHTPDAIILDLMMPDVDGFTLLADLRADDRTGQMPVLMLTAKVDPETRAEALRRGVDVFFSKPTPLAELFEQLERLLGARR